MNKQETTVDPINLDALHACSTPCPEVRGYNFENWYVSGGNMCQDIDTIDFLNAEIREENFEC